MKILAISAFTAILLINTLALPAKTLEPNVFGDCDNAPYLPACYGGGGGGSSQPSLPGDGEDRRVKLETIRCNKAKISCNQKYKNQPAQLQSCLAQLDC
jgi:hypothetical protein